MASMEIKRLDLWGGKTSVALRLPVRKRGVARSDADSTKQPGAEHNRRARIAVRRFIAN
jgi:hypothetical protein